MGVTLDTSGDVIVNQTRLRWPDLDAFTQGYVEALLRYAYDADVPGGPRAYGLTLRFSDLAPETLAAILKDCSEAQQLWPHVTTTVRAGASFWTQRQMMVLAEFGPTTPSLGDDGKVRLS